jgi:hypothetical protein
MSVARELSKLAELRLKTDRDLVQVIGQALENALSIVAPDRSADSAARLRGRAEKIYAKVATLIPKVEDPAERRGLEARLSLLREGLEQPEVMAAGSRV